jgi:tRNA nucleotidyltransferase (CCA-adding enzyme)
VSRLPFDFRPPTIPAAVFGILKRLQEKGKRGWIVGGCVRDLLRGLEPKDWDIATDARPEEVVRMFRRVIETGLQHGTVTVMEGGVGYEVTTLRGEGAYSDGRRPDSVAFVDDIVEDLARRDFTFNAIAIDPLNEALVDPFGGQADLEGRVLRAVGDARERFAEDGLRVLRAARFSATLEVEIDPATERAMGDARSIATFKKVSAERVRDEWLKSMAAARPSRAFEAMARTNLLAAISPELDESRGCAQNRYHAYDVWGHAMACLDSAPPDPVLRMAALLHDIGKPRSRAFSEKTKDWTFYNHEAIGAKMADPLLTQLKFPNDVRKRVVALVQHHLICYTPDWTDTAVRRWLKRVGTDVAPQLYELGRADARGKGRPCDDDLRHIDELQARAEALLSAGAALSTRDLSIGGRELMRELSLSPGPLLGVILDKLLEIVLEDPSKNEPAALLEEARRIVRDGPS